VVSEFDSVITGYWSSTNHHLDAELMEMIERADTDGDGEISPEEFYAIMTKKTFT
jgi:Ca2+-binding EF-hand superfamily protein